jgi:hypothetical protein
VNAVVPISARRILLARVIAIAADVIQIALLPMVIAGAISPVDDLLDLVVAMVLTYLVGWHIAFVPSFIVKLLPIAEFAPTWTAAIFIATWRDKAPAQPLPPPLPRTEFIDIDPGSVR